MNNLNIPGVLLGLALSLFFLAGCDSTQSLQEYYVSNAENPNFLALDVPANIVKLDEAGLSETQKEALGSLRKLNILAFRKTTENAGAYLQESARVQEILGDPDFKELMKLNSKQAKGVVKYLGEGDAIDEVVIFGDSKEQGFALIRVLGDDMNPAHLMQLVQALEKSDLEGDAFRELSGLFKD